MRIFCKMGNYWYRDRLGKLGLFLLENNRMRDDFLEVCKTMDSDMLPPLAGVMKTKGNKHKIKGMENSVTFKTNVLTSMCLESGIQCLQM